MSRVYSPDLLPSHDFSQFARLFQTFQNDICQSRRSMFQG
jgi:hypothetical protein